MSTPDHAKPAMSWEPQAEQALLDMVPQPFIEMARQKDEDIARERGTETVSMSEVSIAKARYLGGTL